MGYNNHLLLTHSTDYSVTSDLQAWLQYTGIIIQHMVITMYSTKRFRMFSSHAWRCYTVLAIHGSCTSENILANLSVCGLQLAAYDAVLHEPN